MPKFWSKLKPLPVAKLFLTATDVDEVAADQIAEGVTIGMATPSGAARAQDSPHG